ncbi:Uncharacterised protein [Stenotrophomonas maltophilia]|nr:Uncharacterised protein [Stenotrophomonas maltophilia]
MSLPAGTASTHRADLSDASGGPSPSVEGLPRQGRGEAGKGRGPRVAQQRVGRRAERVASRARSVQGHYGVIPAAHRTARISRDASGGPSPSVEGLPRQGRGEAGKGRGPRVAQQRVGRRAERVASRARSVQGHYGVMPAAHPRTARISRDASGGPSPSVEGLPRQGRGEAGKGRGPRVAQQRVGRRAERVASRARSVQGHYGVIPAAHPRTARISVMHLEDQAPLLRGCPDRGGERPAKGGAHALRSNVWGDAQSASRPAPDQYRVTTA